MELFCTIGVFLQTTEYAQLPSHRQSYLLGSLIFLTVEPLNVLGMRQPVIQIIYNMNLCPFNLNCLGVIPVLQLVQRGSQIAQDMPGQQWIHLENIQLLQNQII